MVAKPCVERVDAGFAYGARKKTPMIPPHIIKLLKFFPKLAEKVCSTSETPLGETKQLCPAEDVFEFGSWGYLVRLSSGNTLRFLHAVHEMLAIDVPDRSPMVVFVSPRTFARTVGLCQHVDRSTMPSLDLTVASDSGDRTYECVMECLQEYRKRDKDAPIGHILWVKPAEEKHANLSDKEAQVNALTPRLIHFLNDFPARHNNVIHRGFEGYPPRAISFGSQRVPFCRIDRVNVPFPKNPLCQRRWFAARPLAERENCSSQQYGIILFLRIATEDITRNTPDDHYDAVANVAAANHVVVAGISDARALPRSGERFSALYDQNNIMVLGYEDWSYLQQIRLFQRHLCAFGVNGSALDLASAAGIPVLREFDPPHIVSHSNPGTEPYQRSVSFNWYLGVAANIGIRYDLDGERTPPTDGAGSPLLNGTPRNAHQFLEVLRRFVAQVIAGELGEPLHTVVPLECAAETPDLACLPDTRMRVATRDWRP